MVAVVATVSAPVAAEDPVMSTVDDTMQVAGLEAAVGSDVTAHTRLMTPTKLFVGEAVMVAVFAVAAPATRESGPLLASVNFDGFTLITIVPVDPV